MPWLMFLLAVLSFVLLCYAHSLLLGILWTVLVIVFFTAGTLKLIAAQVGNASRDAGHIISPEELRRYREQAQARKESSESAPAPQAAAPASTPADIIDVEFREVEKAPMIAAPAHSPNSSSSLPG